MVAFDEKEILFLLNVTIKSSLNRCNCPDILIVHVNVCFSTDSLNFELDWTGNRTY